MQVGKLNDRKLPEWSITLGNAIRQRRKAFGLTQRELANTAGCSTVAVIQVEAGKPTARLELAMRMMIALGLEFKLQDGGRGIVDRS